MLLFVLPGYTPAGMPPDPSILTVSAFEAKLQQFILEQYHQRPHRETGEAPQARWAGSGFLPRLPESLEQLDLTLAAYVGESVIMRYDPRAIAEIHIFHHQ